MEPAVLGNNFSKFKRPDFNTLQKFGIAANEDSSDFLISNINAIIASHAQRHMVKDIDKRHKHMERMITIWAATTVDGIESVEAKLLLSRVCVRNMCALRDWLTNISHNCTAYMPVN